MRRGTTAAALAVLLSAGLLAGCGTAEPLEPPKPRQTLHYYDAERFPRMARLAEDYCVRYDKRAYPYRQRPAGEGFLATFVCR